MKRDGELFIEGWIITMNRMAMMNEIKMIINIIGDDIAVQ